MEREVSEFFQRYEKANLLADIPAIGNLYAETFMFGGTKGVQSVRKEDFLKVVPKMKSYFATLGLSETRLTSVDTTAVDSRYVLARVAWTMKLENSLGVQHFDTAATYVLDRCDEDNLAIVFQIDHQDLASVVKAMSTR